MRIPSKALWTSPHITADAIYATPAKPRRQAQALRIVLRTIASDLVSGPERSEPRARKRRPKDYQLYRTRNEKVHGHTPKRPKNLNLNVLNFVPFSQG